MSRATVQRDAVAPSLFPFLAVLLCTMGALVLILMLIVSGAQASALRLADESEKQAEEVESQLAAAAQGFQKQLNEGRLELEKKRLSLQHLEKHAQEIMTEMEQLQETAKLAQAEAATDEASQQAQASAITELEQQLLSAQEQLKQKLDKPDGDKPIFAIIPYNGPNGTHRRPIYLECLQDGIRIQPEGVLIRLADLEPPYGPGNPLDAALRTIRSAYVPANGAVTSTAYPLLIVRPSGIRSYAMARAAMSGWDDQFGYELVGDELELVFPDGEPGLPQKIAQALDLARDRQAALIMAMPQKYRELTRREAAPLGGGQPGLGGMSSYGGDDLAGDLSGSSLTSDSGWNNSGPAVGDATRGGWADGSAGAAPSNASLGSQSSPGSAGQSGMAGSDSLLGFGEASPLQLDSERDSTRPSGNAGPGNHLAGGDSSGTSGSLGDNFFGASASNTQGSLGAYSSSSSAASNSSSPTGTSDGGTPGASGGSGQANMSGNQMALPGAPSQSTNSLSASSSGGGQAATSSVSQSATPSGESPLIPDDARDPQAIPQLSLNRTFNSQPNSNEPSTPVAARKGRGWAWTQGPPSQTSVVRAIRLQCREDRWIVLADAGNQREPNITIMFNEAPQQRAEQLAKIVADRVDQWGLALAGGYWKPVLEVEVAPGAQWRFTQLQQLLSGSGLEVQRLPTATR